jgi:hypothetical protein
MRGGVVAHLQNTGQVDWATTTPWHDVEMHMHPTLYVTSMPHDAWVKLMLFYLIWLVHGCEE